MYKRMSCLLLLLLLSAEVCRADTPVPVKRRSRATAFIVAGSVLTCAGFVIVGLWGALAASPRKTNNETDAWGRALAEGVFASTGGVAFGTGVPLLSIGIAEKVAERRAVTVNVAVRF